MGFYFKVAPGVRVRVTNRGVRTSIGPRAARVHVGGGYRPGISTGAGPVTLYHSVGGTRRRRPAATRTAHPVHRGASAAQVAKLAQAQDIYAHLKAISDLHRHPVLPVVPPVAPPPPPIDEAAIRSRHESEAQSAIPFWKRSARSAAVAQADAAAAAEISARRAELEQAQREGQAELDTRWAELVGNDADSVLATLGEAFEDNGLYAAAVSVDGAEASIVVFVPGPELVPAQMPKRNPSGSWSIRKMTQSESAGFYITAVCGHVLAAVRETLAVAPGLASVRAAAVRLSAPDVYGKTHLECLTVATFARSRLEGVDWANADSPAIFSQTGTDGHVNMAGRVKHLEPLDLSSEPELAALVAAVDIDTPTT